MLYLLYSCVSECAFKRADVSMKTSGFYVQNINEKCLIAAFFLWCDNDKNILCISVLLVNGGETSVVELNKTLVRTKE